MNDDSCASALRQMAFIGGGNTARASSGDLRGACAARAESLTVVAPQRDKPCAEFGLRVLCRGDARFSRAEPVLAEPFGV